MVAARSGYNAMNFTQKRIGLIQRPTG